MTNRSTPALVICLFACGADPQQDALPATTSTTTATTSGDSTAIDSSETRESDESSEDDFNGESTGGDPPDASTSAASFGASSTTTTATTGETDDPSTGEAIVCGDGIVQPGEECDDPGDLHCHECLRDRLVFVTSEGFQGDWALSGVDYWCNHLAAQAGLITDNKPRFKTWAATSAGSPADRLSHARGRYVLVNDLVFADSWDDLVAGKLLNPLAVDENGQTRDFPVWTGARPDGTPVPGATVCNDWTTDDFWFYGHYGFSFETDGDWTNLDHPTNPIPCDATRSLYCFESP